MRINNYLRILEDKYNAWHKADEQERSRQLNYILPVIQTISLMNFMLQFSEQPSHVKFGVKFNKILTEFEISFLKLSQTTEKTLQTQSSDFSKLTFAKLQNLTILNEKELHSLRSNIRAKELKYENAHLKIAFNYGRFFEIALANLEQSNAISLAAKIKDAFQEDDISALLALAATFPLEANAQHLPLDDLENHALLNQISNFTRNPSLLLNDSEILKLEKTEEIAKTTHKALSADESRSELTLSEQLAASKTPTLDSHILETTIGLETEFLLKDISGAKISSAAYAKRAENIILKKTLADVNARRNMQSKYGKEPSLPQLSSLTELLYPLTTAEVAEIITTKEELAEIISFIKEKGITPDDRLREAIANMTNEEIYFFHLLFREAESFQFIFDGINDGETLDLDLNRACDLITQNMWHEKTLDMIRASELSIGPFKASEYKEIVRHVKQMEDVAAKCSLALVKPNVQINFSATKQGSNILLPEVTKAQITKIKIPAIGREFIKLLQDSLVLTAQQNPHLLRCDYVDAALDRKKGLQTELEGTEYFRVAEDEAAFLSHKRLAAKNVTLRLSKFSPDTAVIEVRLVGNNPHFAQYNDAVLLNEKTGLTDVLVSLLPNFYPQLNQATLTNIGQSCEIKPDGSIEDVERKDLAHKTVASEQDKITAPSWQQRVQQAAVPAQAELSWSMRLKQGQTLGKSAML